MKLSRYSLSVGFSIKESQNIVVIRKLSWYGGRPIQKGRGIFANGPAIWGGCVTRREHRAESWYFSQKAVTVQGGYGALFAVMVQILLSITRVAVQG
jgi:hypothetical protein